MKITLKSPEDLETAAKNLFYVSRKYAEAVDQFHNVHGHTAKDSMYLWRNKLLECLKNPGKKQMFKETVNLEYEEQGRTGNE